MTLTFKSESEIKFWNRAFFHAAKTYNRFLIDSVSLGYMPPVFDSEGEPVNPRDCPQSYCAYYADGCLEEYRLRMKPQ